MRRLMIGFAASFVLAILYGTTAFAGTTYPGTTAITFENPQGTVVSSVGLVSGTDVWVRSMTTCTGDGCESYIDQGKVQLQIATDGLGNPTSVAGNVEWVRIDVGDGGKIPSDGVYSFPVDLDGLYDLGIVDSSDHPLQNVSCSIQTVGFRVHYNGGGGQNKVDGHFSPGTPLSINCGICGESTNLIIGIDMSAGDGSPYPGDSGPWAFRVTTTNCTPYSLYGVKVQGGSNGWAPIPMPYLDNVLPELDGGATQTSLGVKGNNKNQIITWIGDMPTQSSVALTVIVDGSIKAQNPCTPAGSPIPEPGSVLFLSGPFSAAFSDPVTLLSDKTSYTDRVSITVTCPNQ